MTHLVTITGATGNVGRALTERLLKSGVKVRAVARSAEKLAPLSAKGADSRAGDLTDTPFLAEALRGVDAVFALIPEHLHLPDFQDEQRRVVSSFVAALKDTGVPRVVALSAIGANVTGGVGLSTVLHEFEGLLTSIPGLSVVALRPAFYMENHLAAIPIIKSAGINGGLAQPDVPLPMVATRDVAAIAADYLRAPTFEGYTARALLGPRDYTYRQTTTILGSAIGIPDLAYVAFPYEGFRHGLLQAGFSASGADALAELMTAFNEGHIQKTVSRDGSNTTPTTLEDFARDVFAPAFYAA